MAAGPVYTGVCDFCGEECDATVEEVHSMECSARCTDGPALYHSACLIKHIRRGSRRDSSYCFICPRGRGKNVPAGVEPCKGLATKCNPVIVKAKKKEPPPAPPAVPLPQRRGQQAAGSGAKKAAAGQSDEQPAPRKRAEATHRPAGPPQPPVVRLPPVLEQPKPDPLGRNTERAAQVASKAARKNQRRATKRRGEGEQGPEEEEARMANGGSVANGSLSRSSSDAGGLALQTPQGSYGGADELEAYMRNERFISDIDRFNRLLGLGSDKDDDGTGSGEGPSGDAGGSAWAGADGGNAWAAALHTGHLGGSMLHAAASAPTLAPHGASPAAADDPWRPSAPLQPRPVTADPWQLSAPTPPPPDDPWRPSVAVQPATPADPWQPAAPSPQPDPWQPAASQQQPPVAVPVPVPAPAPVPVPVQPPPPLQQQQQHQQVHHQHLPPQLLPTGWPGAEGTARVPAAAAAPGGPAPAAPAAFAAGGGGAPAAAAGEEDDFDELLALLTSS